MDANINVYTFNDSDEIINEWTTISSSDVSNNITILADAITNTSSNDFIITTTGTGAGSLYLLTDPETKKNFILNNKEKTFFLYKKRQLFKLLKILHQRKVPKNFLESRENPIVPCGYRKGRRLRSLSTRDLSKIIEETRHPISYLAHDLLKQRRLERLFNSLQDLMRYFYSNETVKLKKHNPFNHMYKEIEKRFNYLYQDYKKVGTKVEALRKIHQWIEDGKVEDIDREDFAIEDFDF